MTLYNVTNNSNYPKSVGQDEFQPGESKELDLEERQVENALRGFEFEELEEESDEDSEEQDLKKTVEEDSQELKSEEENKDEVN